ncbi:MAG: LysR family transcriptional regulator [Rhodospirillales bacterium]|nr:LysR family transcriptional regulator [Rhodospirillales bacterium]
MRQLSDPLTYFLVAARHEHLTKAAQELEISQPALSRNIARLERAYGVQLFDRLGRGLRLNMAGQILLQHLERAKAELDDAADAIREHTQKVAHTISIGFLATFGVTLIPELVRGYVSPLEVVPPFRLLQGPAPFLRARLAARDIDLCIASPRFPDANLEWKSLFHEELFVVVPSNHSLAATSTIDLAAVADEPFVMLKSEYGLRQVAEELCLDAGFTPRIAFEVEEVATLRGLVGAGVGVAIAPRPVLEVTALTKDLRVRAPRCRRAVGLLWRKDRRLPSETVRFRDYVLSHFGSADAKSSHVHTV